MKLLAGDFKPGAKALQFGSNRYQFPLSRNIIWEAERESKT